MKTTSCGILVLNGQAELLLCHATGTAYWDIPKGGMDPGETECEAALRETSEETSLHFEPAQLLDLGRFLYRPGKDLYLFAALTERVDTGRLVCRSHFVDHWGRSRPEMDGFAWTRFADVPQRCAKSMTALLTRSLALPDVLHRLQGGRTSAL
ncbi:NUDIX domain-containing protein [Ideonella sp. BN130291]|uniref:NUDIX domain-containing protein n=1 Tax=Ideonella sp. BN130291 TaxID=3112940 RepID=UPI002E262547|nr:NUDIX domain-containing protein [Ideonella sp. BN130291]